MLTTKVLCHEILAAENILLLHYNYFGTVWLALRLLVLKQIQLKTTAVNLLDIVFFFHSYKNTSKCESTASWPSSYAFSSMTKIIDAVWRKWDSVGFHRK